MGNLKQALLFLHVAELEAICARLGLAVKAKKIILIVRIVHFISTGEIIKEPKMPAISNAR